MLSWKASFAPSKPSVSIGMPFSLVRMPVPLSLSSWRFITIVNVYIPLLAIAHPLLLRQHSHIEFFFSPLFRVNSNPSAAIALFQRHQPKLSPTQNGNSAPYSLTSARH